MVTRYAAVLATVATLMAFPVAAQNTASVVHASVQSIGSTGCPKGYEQARASGGPVCASCRNGTLMTHPLSSNPVCVSCARGSPNWHAQNQGFVCR